MAYPLSSHPSSYSRQADHPPSNARWTNLPPSGHPNTSLFPSPSNSTHAQLRDFAASSSMHYQLQSTSHPQATDYRPSQAKSSISSPSRPPGELSEIEYMSNLTKSSPSRSHGDAIRSDTPQSSHPLDLNSSRRSIPPSSITDTHISSHPHANIQPSGTPSSTYGSEETTEETSIQSPIESTTNTGSSSSSGPLNGLNRHQIIDLEGRMDASLPSTARNATSSPGQLNTVSVLASLAGTHPNSTATTITGYERKPRKAKGPARPVGRPPILRAHAPTRVPVNLLPTLYEGLLKHLNQGGREEYDKYAIQALVISMSMQEDEEELTGDEQSRYASLFQQCLKTVQDDSLSRYKLTRRRKNGRIDGDSGDASRDKKVIERYHELLDSNKYRVERLYRNSEAAVHYVWTRDDFIRFKEAFRKFGYAPTANRQIADFVGKGMHPNHIQYFKRALKQRLGGSMIRDLIESPAYDALIAAAPPDDGRGLADYLPPQEETSIDAGTKVLFGSAVGGSFFGGSSTQQASQLSRPSTSNPPTAPATAATATVPPAAPPKRRGRPPKPKPPPLPSDPTAMDTSGSTSTSTSSSATVTSPSPQRKTSTTPPTGITIPANRYTSDGNPLFQRLQSSYSASATTAAVISPPSSSQQTTRQTATNQPRQSQNNSASNTIDKNFLADMAVFGITEEDFSTPHRTPPTNPPVSSKKFYSQSHIPSTSALPSHTTLKESSGSKRVSSEMVSPSMEAAPPAKKKSGSELPPQGMHSLPLNPTSNGHHSSSTRLNINAQVLPPPPPPPPPTSSASWSAHAAGFGPAPPTSMTSPTSTVAQQTSQQQQQHQEQPQQQNKPSQTPQNATPTPAAPLPVADFSLPPGTDPMAMLSQLMQHTAQLTQMVQRLSSAQGQAQPQYQQQQATEPDSTRPEVMVPSKDASMRDHNPPSLPILQTKQQSHHSQGQQYQAPTAATAPSRFPPEGHFAVQQQFPNLSTQGAQHSVPQIPKSQKSMDIFNRPAPPTTAAVSAWVDASLNSPRQPFQTAPTASNNPPYHLSQPMEMTPQQLGTASHLILDPGDKMKNGGPAIPSSSPPVYPLLPAPGLGPQAQQHNALQLPPYQSQSMNQAQPYPLYFGQPLQLQQPQQLPQLAPQHHMSQQQMLQMQQQHLLSQRQQARYPPETSRTIEAELLAFDDYPLPSRSSM